MRSEANRDAYAYNADLSAVLHFDEDESPSLLVEQPSSDHICRDDDWMIEAMDLGQDDGIEDDE